MKYVKVVDKKVEMLSYTIEDGYIEVEDSVGPGWVQNDDGTFMEPPRPLVSLLLSLRRKRNFLLETSDWTGISDSALTSDVSANWKLYRQRLRDLPSGLNTPAKVKNAVWPSKP